MSSEPKYRRSLNSKQLEVLELLYKFRFGSSDLIAQYFGKSHRMFAFKRLKTLEEQGLIAKHFDGSYRLAGKPAAYYLLPTGARVLQKDGLPNLTMIYKNKTVSESFIDHSLKLFGVFNQLRTIYPELKCFTKSDLNQEKYAYFPKPLPDAFLSIKKNEVAPKRFFLELLESSTPIFAHKRRIKQYIEYAESGEWDVTNSDLPAILLVCETELLQQKIQKQTLKLMQDTDEDILFYTTTPEKLKILQKDSAIWQDATDPDETLSLTDM